MNVNGTGLLAGVLILLSWICALTISNSVTVRNILLFLFGLTNLEMLYLNYNELTGTISTKIGDLKSLQQLYLSSNKLTGNIPEELYGLTSLQELDLSGNELAGRISTRIGDLKSLQALLACE
jgi:Leucine-rich repeat (LRR) protein